ncbi:MAG: hypothetical protein DRR16_00920 [Candidatus Parabeggiatoa sp. nov. 3]|nr:MAG: hypothetical protein DRR00_02310 [Gammaproteobacteria bacterium]RKZ69336.1 MAG: hypothetical protein DRQ99_01275 [Gammaproteobacteria bacterium]RKZ90035.1 MAG: hypothetical protein DRR16_00920 [Gammaproteobacteria bacterium]
MILGINNLQHAIPILVPGLESLEEQYDQSEWLGFVSSGSVIQPISSKEQPLSSWLPEYSPGSAILNLKVGTEQPQWCQNEKQAVAYMGKLENAVASRTYLLELGYEFEGNTDIELFCTLLNRYMDVGSSPVDAMRYAFLRLQGHFAVMALCAQPNEQLIVGSRGYSLSLGVCYESLIVGSDTQILKQLSPSVMAIGESKPVVLYSV